MQLGGTTEDPQLYQQYLDGYLLVVIHLVYFMWFRISDKPVIDIIFDISYLYFYNKSLRIEIRS